MDDKEKPINNSSGSTYGTVNIPPSTRDSSNIVITNNIGARLRHGLATARQAIAGLFHSPSNTENNHPHDMIESTRNNR